jgi:hypothetical protein
VWAASQTDLLPCEPQAVTKALAMVCNAESREWVLTSLCSLLEVPILSKFISPLLLSPNTHTCTHARTHARTHAHTHIHVYSPSIYVPIHSSLPSLSMHAFPHQETSSSRPPGQAWLNLPRSPTLKSARITSTLQDGEWYSKISAADTAWHIQARLRGAPEPTGSRIAEALGASIKDKDWAVRKSAVVAMAALVNKDEALPALLSR